MPANITNKIVGGLPTERFKYPWITSIQLLGSHFCAGTLLDANTMLTAGHCSQIDSSSGFLKVQAHRHWLPNFRFAEDGLKFKVLSITTHPDYTQSRNDVGVWKLELIAGDPANLPVDVVELDDGSYAQENSELRIAGWGRTSIRGSLAPRLLEADVSVVSNEECGKAYPFLHESCLCASNPGKDTCQGDSGGPLFTERDGKIVLVGVTSFGMGCGNSEFPGVYASVGYFADWIKNQI